MSDDDSLVQDFVAEPGVFFLGVKRLNYKSVAAARGRDGVLPVVGMHLFRQTLESCWDGGRIDSGRTRLNYSLLPDLPMTATAMVDAALAAVASHGINWAKLRKDKIVGVELVFSLPVTFQGDVRAFFMDSLAWVRYEFPQPITVVAAVVHLDEAAPHMHVVLVPIVAQGKMDGHDVAGYTTRYMEWVNSFHQQVAQRYGLNKPRRKVQMKYRERQQLADRVLANMVAGGAAWAGNPAAVAVQRNMLLADPVPMARALGLMKDKTDEEDPTAYAVVGVSGPDAMTGAATAYLCNAVTAGRVPDGDGDADSQPNAEPTERLIRIRDTDLSPDTWNADLGEHVPVCPFPARSRLNATALIRSRSWFMPALAMLPPASRHSLA